MVDCRIDVLLNRVSATRRARTKEKNSPAIVVSLIAHTRPSLGGTQYTTGLAHLSIPRTTQLPDVPLYLALLHVYLFVRRPAALPRWSQTVPRAPWAETAVAQALISRRGRSV
ncbi:unnamed protein product, partial [Ectocarpus sp. 12 AP-2014]